MGLASTAGRRPAFSTTTVTIPTWSPSRAASPLRCAPTPAALDLVCAAIERAGLRPGTDVALAVDVAANQILGPNGDYLLHTENRRLRPAQWFDELTQWSTTTRSSPSRIPCTTTGWIDLTGRLGDRQVLGDDLFATRLDHAIAGGVANAVLVKPNQATP